MPSDDDRPPQGLSRTLFGDPANPARLVLTGEQRLRGLERGLERSISSVRFARVDAAALYNFAKRVEAQVNVEDVLGADLFRPPTTTTISLRARSGR